MSRQEKRLVYSTESGTGSAKEPVRLPSNPAAAIPTRQLDTPVRVFLERKGRGGKSVSVIKGVRSPTAGQQALLKMLKGQLGTGGTLKEGVIEIQGDHRDKIVAILQELGYAAKRAGG